MARKNAPEFYYSEKKQAYRKRLKNPATGKWSVEVWGKTKAECRANAERRARQLAGEQQSQGSACRVFQYSKAWYDLNSVGVAERTRQGYRNVINNHLCPVIGDMVLAEVTADDAKRVITAAAEKGLGRESQKKIISLMKKLFDAAEESGRIAKNPCRKLKPQGRAPVKKKALTREQQRIVVEALEGEKIYIFVLLALFCGLRREEALGLMWKDVHLDDDTPWLEVCRTCTWPHNQPLIADYTKSEAGHRRLPIPDKLVYALRAEERTCEYVCRTSKNVPYSESAFRRAWEAVEDRQEHTVRYKRKNSAGVWVKTEQQLNIGDEVPYKKCVVSFDFDFTPHNLRHTYITELIYANVPLKTVQYLAGHASPDITLAIYTDLMLHRPSDTIEGVNESFKHFADMGGAAGGTKNAENAQKH